MFVVQHCICVCVSTRSLSPKASLSAFAITLCMLFKWFQWTRFNVFRHFLVLHLRLRARLCLLGFNPKLFLKERVFVLKQPHAIFIFLDLIKKNFFWKKEGLLVVFLLPVVIEHFRAFVSVKFLEVAVSWGDLCDQFSQPWCKCRLQGQESFLNPWTCTIYHNTVLCVTISSSSLLSEP